MEKQRIEDWLKISYGSGSGDGDGDGDSYGSGSGDGSGSGYGSGYGYGYGDGYGYGSGYGDGYGSGSGDGSGSGYGSGYGYGFGLKRYNEHYIFKIDGVQTIITNIKNDVAKGFIVNDDLTLEKTFVVKSNNFFAHGKTIKEAISSLTEKIYDELDIEEKIKEFKNKFNNKDKYSGHLFFKWHHILTGSCLQGRENFVKNSGYSLNDEFTVKEFLKIVKNSYGWNNIKELEEYYIEGERIENGKN